MPINKHYSDQNGNQYCTARPSCLPGQIDVEAEFTAARDMLCGEMA